MNPGQPGQPGHPVRIGRDYVPNAITTASSRASKRLVKKGKKPKRKWNNPEEEGYQGRIYDPNGTPQRMPPSRLGDAFQDNTHRQQMDNIIEELDRMSPRKQMMVANFVRMVRKMKYKSDLKKKIYKLLHIDKKK